MAASGYAWGVHGLDRRRRFAFRSPRTAPFLATWTLTVELPVLIWMVVTLPGGRFGRARLDRIGRVAVAAATAGVIAGALTDPEAMVAGTDFAAARNPLSIGFDTGAVSAMLIIAGSLLATGVLVTRWRRTVGPDRAVLRWFVVLQVGGSLIVIPLISFGPEELSVTVAQILSALGMLALITGIRRHHVFGIERWFERTLRFVLLAGLLAALYAGAIAIGTEVVGSSARTIAAVVIALAVLPLRDRVARAVHRFVYGDRVDAHRLIRGVTEQAATTTNSRELLGRILDELVDNTDLRGVAVEFEHSDLSVEAGNMSSDERNPKRCVATASRHHHRRPRPRSPPTPTSVPMR